MLTLLATIALLAAIVPSTTSAFTAKVAGSTNTAATNSYFTCDSAFTAYSATTASYLEYALNEASGSTYAADATGTIARRGSYQGAMATSTTAPLACAKSSGGAYTLNGTSSWVSTSTAQNDPDTFSLAIWFKTTAAQGVLLGFGLDQTATSSGDRLLYLNTGGQLVFGVATSGNTGTAVTSTAAYTDGTWHQAVATVSPTTGLALYVDGALVASNTAAITPVSYSGYWRIGAGGLNGWPNAASGYYKGSLRYAAVTRTVLTAKDILAMYVAGR